MRHSSTLAATALALNAALLLAQPAAAPPPRETVIKSDVNNVLVDVVVRDRKGRLIRGLKASDIKILEDGVEQEIASFREVRSTARSQEDAEKSPSGADFRGEKVQVSTQNRLVSLVFDRLGPEGRRLSRQAALEFLKTDRGPNVYYGVFTIDRGFRVLQPYTADIDRLRAAIETGTGGERSDFSNAVAGLQSAVQSGQGSQGAAAAVAASAGAGMGAVDGAALSSEQAATIAQEMVDFSQMIIREDLGRMSVFSLWAIVKELRKLPGRKTVLYFAEGLQMPNGLVEQYKSMISEANLANVTVYAIDARGLTVASDQAAATQLLAQAAQWSRYARNTETESAAGNRQEFRTFDRATDSVRANAQQAMLELAESTGGFLIANTNDLRPSLEKLSEEFNTYYELTYSPKNQLYDGRFREISVNLNRDDAVVQARNGYFGLPFLDGQTVYPYEAPLLRVLGRNPLPRDLDFRSGVIRFRQRSGLLQASLVFDLPLKDIAFVHDDEAKLYRTHISVLALVKDSTGRVVAKLSRDVPLNEPVDKFTGFQQGRFIVTRVVNLPPGRYTVESVAADQEGQRVAAKKSVLVVPETPSMLGLSDLTLIRRLDAPAEFPDPMDPLHIKAGRVIPTLVDAVPGGAGKMLSVFFTIYPDQAAGEAPRLILDLLKNGELIARATPQLPEPDISGAIPYLANTPLDAVTPAQYQFRATLINGNSSAQKSIYINIE